MSLESDGRGIACRRGPGAWTPASTTAMALRGKGDESLMLTDAGVLDTEQETVPGLSQGPRNPDAVAPLCWRFA